MSKKINFVFAAAAVVIAAGFGSGKKAAAQTVSADPEGCFSWASGYNPGDMIEHNRGRCSDLGFFSPGDEIDVTGAGLPPRVYIAPQPGYQSPAVYPGQVPGYPQQGYGLPPQGYEPQGYDRQYQGENHCAGRVIVLPGAKCLKENKQEMERLENQRPTGRIVIDPRTGQPYIIR